MSIRICLHVCNDSGCDLLAASPDTIPGVYEEYSDWIVDYDRSQIEKIFEKE